ncbi:MAG TPA: hypothetical protein VLK37_10425 [Solirubrobacterales bacterium]|nr:hypothetical protein [Solirubrobacterales bacterium]
MEKVGLAIAGVGLVVAVVALFVSSGSDGSGDESRAAEAATPGKLAAVDFAVHDVSPFEDGRAYLEVTLHNMGDRLVVIDGLQVRVRHVYKLRRCASQDDLLLSHVYGLTLPAGARDGETFETALHQQVGADEADRFRVGLSTKLPAGDPTSLYLFETKISLQTDGPRPNLPLGMAVTGLPELPTPGEYYWDHGTLEVLHNFVLGEPDYARYLLRSAMPCWRANTTALQEVGSGDKVRSKDLESVIDGLVEPFAGALE